MTSHYLSEKFFVFDFVVQPVTDVQIIKKVPLKSFFPDFLFCFPTNQQINLQVRIQSPVAKFYFAMRFIRS